MMSELALGTWQGLLEEKSKLTMKTKATQSWKQQLSRTTFDLIGYQKSPSVKT